MATVAQIIAGKKLDAQGFPSAPAAAPVASSTPTAVLYFHERYDCYECMGCGEFIETPGMAVLHQGRPREPVKNNPENRMLWLELHMIDHQKCANYQDVEKAKAFRAHGNRRPAPANKPRFVVVQGGRA